MSNYIKQTLEDGESMLYNGQFHWLAMSSGIVLSCFLLIPALIIAAAIAEESILLALIPISMVAFIDVLILLLGIYIVRKMEFTITTNRLIHKEGIINIHLTEIPLYKIETITISQKFYEAPFSVGSILIIGSGGTKHLIVDIVNPIEVRQVLNDAIKKVRQAQI